MEADLVLATTPSPTSLEDVDQFLKNQGASKWFERALKLSIIKNNATVVTYLTTYGNVFILSTPYFQEIFDRSLLFAVKNNCFVTVTLVADACGIDAINAALNFAIEFQTRQRIVELLQRKINAVIKGTDYAVSHTHNHLRTCSANRRVPCDETLLFTVEKPVTIYQLNPLNLSETTSS